MMRLFALVLLAVLVYACTPAPAEEERILFLSHAYDWGRSDAIDPRLPELTLDSFQSVWLGGDVTSKPPSPEVVEQITAAWLGEKSMHWVRGNHDFVLNQADALPRSDFYLHETAGYHLLVLNTNLWATSPPKPDRDSLFLVGQQAQKAFLDAVPWNTLTNKPLFVLHHHGLARALGIETQAFNINPETYWLGPDSSHTLEQVLFSRLKAVQADGGAVYVIGGDMGIAAKTFQYQLPSGIWILGAGINNSVMQSSVPYYVTANSPDSVLVLHLTEKPQRVTWRFIPLKHYLRKIPRVEPARRYEAF